MYEYNFGNELLIAPVYEQGAISREIDLPEGKWINFWTDEIVEGNRKIFVDAPIDVIPIYVKSGAIIPMRNYNRSIESGTNDSLIIHIYPDENSEFILMEDDGVSNDYLKGNVAITDFEIRRIKTDMFLKSNQ